MKKITAIFTLLGLLALLIGCDDNKPITSQTALVPTTTQKDVYSPAPPQPLPFNSLEEARDFILDPDSSTADFLEYSELEDAHYEMIDKFKREGFFPYVLVDGGKEIRSIFLHPQGRFEDIGVNHAYSYNGYDYVSFIYFIKEGLEDKAKAGVVDYMNSKLTQNLTDYKEVFPVYNGQKVDAVYRNSVSGNTESHYLYWIQDKQFFVTILTKAPESEIIDFIAHMTIEKLPLTA